MNNIEGEHMVVAEEAKGHDKQAEAAVAAQDDEDDEEEEVEEAEDVDDEDDDEEAVDEDGEPEYIWLSPSEFHDPHLPYLFGAPVNPHSTRTHSRRSKTAESLFPHLSDTLYRCKEYPHGIYINSYGQLCPDDKRSGLYQIDERAAANDQADDEMAQAEDAVAEQDEAADDDDDEEEEEEEADEEEADNDQAAPDARDVTWVKAENALRVKKGLKRKKVVPDDDPEEEEDDYQPHDDSDDEDDSDDDDAQEGDAEAAETDDEFKDEELEGTDEDHEWDPQTGQKPSAATADAEGDDEEDDEDEEEEHDSQGRPLPNEYEAEAPQPGVRRKDKAPAEELTPEQRKEAYLRELQAAEESQTRMNQVAAERQRQRNQDLKNLRLLETWSEQWKKIRGQIFREEKASEADPERRKRIKNTSIVMTFEAHVLSKDDPGCDFVFRKPVVRAKKGEAGPKPVPLPPLTASFDCVRSEVVCGACSQRFSNMMVLYRHLAEHFSYFQFTNALKDAAVASAVGQ